MRTTLAQRRGLSAATRAQGVAVSKPRVCADRPVATVGSSLIAAVSLTKNPASRFARQPCREVRVAASTSADGSASIAISGATGLIGSRLVAKLTSQGHKVFVLTRDPGSAQFKLPPGRTQFFGPSDWQRAIAAADAVVNLAGEPIATRWNDTIKEEILRSRVDTTKLLVQAINATPKESRPKVLVSSSAVGFYGTSENATFDEESPSGRDFLARVCREWEAAAGQADTRVVIIRTGIVLSVRGGALAKMLPFFELFLGGPLGSGSQWMSWVHIDDLVSLMAEATLNESYSGVYNGTAPHPVRMADLCAGIGQVKGKPSWLPVPDFALQGLLAEGAETVLKGQKVLPAKAEKEGFKFSYPDISGALRSLLV